MVHMYLDGAHVLGWCTYTMMVHLYLDGALETSAPPKECHPLLKNK